MVHGQLVHEALLTISQMTNNPTMLSRDAQMVYGEWLVKIDKQHQQRYRLTLGQLSTSNSYSHIQLVCNGHFTINKA